jgi:hypothetical protein
MNLNKSKECLSTCERLKVGSFWSGLSGFVFFAIVIVIIWISNFFFMPWYFSAKDGGTGNAGTAGDMFGGITALFSGLAFAGLITTLFMQRAELALQRNELVQTREVFEIQRFENTFFGLLKLLNDHVENIEFSDEYDVSKVAHGRKGLREFARTLSAHVRGETISGSDEFAVSKTTVIKVDTKTILKDFSDIYWKTLESDLAPYFRLIFNIIRHIEGLELGETDDEKHDNRLKYSKILRAHLSSAEVKLIMFNCASDHGAGLKGWIEKYTLLRHIRRDDYLDFEDTLVSVYDPSAFEWDKRNEESSMQ